MRGQPHTHLAALTCEVILQTLDDLLIDAILICLTENVNCSECQIVIHCILHLLELAGWSLADRALLWCLCSFVNITANGANKLLLHNVNVLNVIVYDNELIQLLGTFSADALVVELLFLYDVAIDHLVAFQ